VNGKIQGEKSKALHLATTWDYVQWQCRPLLRKLNL
jgi:hypothetical protein